MPELPEAETIARELNSRLTGRSIRGVHVARRDIVHGDPRSLESVVENRQIMRVHRRAKRVIVELDPAGRLIFHLGMSGRLTVEAATRPVEAHTHIRLRFVDGADELRFRDPRRFGGLWVFDGHGANDVGVARSGRALGPLGVEPLETGSAAFRALMVRKRQIKALLLDQTVIAGLGNIYCDEALFAAGVHPLRRSSDLDETEAARLLRAIKMTLRRAIRYRGSTFMDYRTAGGQEGSFQKHHAVYHRQGQPCHRCETTITRLIAAGRSSFVCPKCQPERTIRKDLSQRRRERRVIK